MTSITNIDHLPDEILGIILQTVINKRTTWLVCHRWQQVARLFDIRLSSVNICDLPLCIIDKFQSKINWNTVSFHYRLAVPFIQRYGHMLNWSTISRKQRLPIWFMRENIHRIDWEVIVYNYALSPIEMDEAIQFARSMRAGEYEIGEQFMYDIGSPSW